MKFSEIFNNTAWKITGARNNYYLSASDAEGGARPVRVETLLARKSLFGNWALIREVQSPMMPVAHIARRCWFGGFAGYETDDSARRVRREVVKGNLSYKAAFDAVQAAEISPPALQLSGSETDGKNDLVLIQHCPEQARSYWRNLAVKP